MSKPNVTSFGRKGALFLTIPLPASVEGTQRSKHSCTTLQI